MVKMFKLFKKKSWNLNFCMAKTQSLCDSVVYSLFFNLDLKLSCSILLGVYVVIVQQQDFLFKSDERQVFILKKNYSNNSGVSDSELN